MLTFSSGLNVKKAEITNLLEDNISDLSLQSTDSGDSEISLDFRGYEIKTVRLTLAANAIAHRSEGNDGWVKL